MESFRRPGLVAALLACLLGVFHEQGFAQEAATDGATRSERGSLRERWKSRDKAATADPSGRAINTPIGGPGDYSYSMVHDGRTRLYRVHVPASYSPERPTPLVLSFHGGGGNMDIQADDRLYGQITKSEQAGFVAVFPNGFSRLGSGKFATWNAGNCCAGARDQNVDDVGFVREIVRSLRGQLNIDPARIFASGMSNGGMFSYRLACEMSGTFKAIASVAGSDGTKNCAPGAPVSILEIHAKDDELVLYEGGAGRGWDKLAKFESVPGTIAKWVRLDGCNVMPQRILETPGAHCEAYTACRGQAEVRLCVTETGGHSWPGGVKARTGAPGSTAISATDTIWDFFQSR